MVILQQPTEPLTRHDARAIRKVGRRLRRARPMAIQINSAHVRRRPAADLLVTLAGWVNRHQLEVIEYLREENRVLKEYLGGRLRLTDAQRRRLAVNGHRLGRQGLIAGFPRERRADRARCHGQRDLDSSVMRPAVLAFEPRKRPRLLLVSPRTDGSVRRKAGRDPLLRMVSQRPRWAPKPAINRQSTDDGQRRS